MTETSKYTVIDRWRRPLWIAAAVALALCAVAWRLSARSFYQAWLAAAMLPWSVSVGSIALMLMGCLTGGRWARVAWPALSLHARLMPLAALLFVPWLFGIDTIYPWAASDVLSQFENTENRQWFFQPWFFIGRTAAYFAIWAALGWNPTRLRWRYNGAGAGLGLIAILLSVTAAGVDWVMSFDPFFTSTLFGAMIGIGAMLSAMSAVVAAVCFVQPAPGGTIDSSALSDLANLLLTFLMLWAYFSFAHFLIMWSGDLPNEASFYAARTAGVWGWVTPLLAIGGFLVPFLCLFSGAFKRSPRAVGALALSLLAVRVVELWWMVLPATGQPSQAKFNWGAVPAVVAAAAIYLLAWNWLLGKSTATVEASL